MIPLWRWSPWEVHRGFIPPDMQAKAMMATILSKSPIAIGYCKQAINRGADTDLRNGLEIEKECWAVVFGTKDKDEGISAFLEKRAPQFPNEY